jgi:putative phage-type endonuclease
VTAAVEIGQPFEVLGNAADEEAWKSLRREGIGASEIAIVMGASSWESILKLYLRKLGEIGEEDEDGDEWLMWGRLLEDKIRAELCRRAEVNLVHRNVLLRSTRHRWALATPDGLSDRDEPVEAKNIAWGYDAAEWEKSIPQNYYLQCQQQMLVSGAPRCLFGALLWGSRLIWEWVPRDEQTIQRIVTVGSQFWARVERREEPPSDGHPDARQILASRATVANAVELFEPEIRSELEVWAESESELKEVRARERVLKRHRDAAADQIAQKMGSYRRGFTSTGWQFEWETVKRRGFTVAPVERDDLKIRAPKL